MNSNAASFIHTSIPQTSVPDIGSRVSDDFMQAFQTSYNMKRQRELDDLNKKRTLQMMDLDAKMMPLKIDSENLAIQKAGLDIDDARLGLDKKKIETKRAIDYLQNGYDNPGDFNSGGSDLGEYGGVSGLGVSQKKNSDGIKLSNYGYESDSSPDHNSNVLKIGHANNKLVDGESAALTKSLADRHGLKSGDMFEATLADGTTITRRYDDTTPSTYKGDPLPETVDIYNQSGSNNFGGKVISIKPLGKKAVAKRDGSDLALPAGPSDGSYDGMVLPPRGSI